MDQKFDQWPRRAHDKILTVEIDYTKRWLQITHENKARNAEIWRKIEVMWSITRVLENKASQWNGHVNRMGETR